MGGSGGRVSYHKAGQQLRRIPQGDAIQTTDAALQQRLQELELCVQSQAREIRALEKIEGLLDRSRELESENRTLREKVDELRTFWTLSRILSSTLNMDEVFRLALHLIGRSLQVDAYSLLLLDEASARLTVKAAFGLPEERTHTLSLALGEGISGIVAETAQPLHVPDVSLDDRFVERSCFPEHRSGRFLPLLAA